MKKILKKATSVLIAIIMIFSVIPLSEFAGMDFNSAEASTLYISSGELSFIVRDGVARVSDCNTYATGKIEIPSSINFYPVNYISFSAFSDCTSVTEVKIPNSVIGIESHAFSGCTSLKKITMPDSVEYIGSSAFYRCESLTGITLSKNLKEIGNTAFYGCKKLQTINIPAAVESIGKGVFNRCYSLKNISVDGDNQYYYSDYYGVLYNKDKTTLLKFPQSNSLTTYSVSKTVTTIADDAFFSCEKLESIKLYKEIENIGSNAFADCKDSLKKYYEGTIEQWSEISISSGNESLDYNLIMESDSENPYYGGKCGESIFWYIDVEGNLFIKGTGEMRDYCSEGSSDYEYAPWYDVRNTIKSISVSDGVTKIGYNAFKGCSELKSVSLGSDVETIGMYSFAYCSNLEEITIPESVKFIYAFAFLSCEKLDTIVIGDNLTEINAFSFDNTAFSNNSANWSGQVLYLGKYLLQADSMISGHYKIKEGTKTIAASAFAGCSYIAGITIPASVINIGPVAFYECDALSDVFYEGTFEQWNSLNIGKENSAIINNVVLKDSDGKTFHAKGSCGDSVEWTLYTNGELVISGTGQMKDYLSSEKKPWSNYSDKITAVTLAQGVTSIGSHTFEYNDNITNLSIPNTVESIGESAFWGCDGLVDLFIPDSVKELKEGCFEYCTGIVSITIGDGVETIGNSSFYECSALRNLSLGKNIKEIGYRAFRCCYKLTDVVIPDSVNIIGYEAFEQCTALKSVTFGKNISYVGLDAFNSCKIENFTYRGDLASWCKIDFSQFANPVEYTRKLYINGNLISGDLVIPDGVEKIGSYTFAELTDITSVYIPDSVKSIGFSAFQSCEGIERVRFSKNITKIGGYAFYKCSNLLNLVLPEKLEEIGQSAFMYCSKMKCARIGKNLKAIPLLAFGYCSNLKSIYYSGSEDEWKQISIREENGSIYGATVYYNCLEDKSYAPEYVVDFFDPDVINTPSRTSIQYGDSIILHINKSKIPEGCSVMWYVTVNPKFDCATNEDGTMCILSPISSGTSTFTAIIFDADGEIVSADAQEMTARAGFFYKFIAFFKSLFGLTKRYPATVNKTVAV